MSRNDLLPESDSVPYWIPDLDSVCVDPDFDSCSESESVLFPADDGSMESEFESLFDSDDIVASKARIRLGY